MAHFFHTFGEKERRAVDYSCGKTSVYFCVASALPHI
jgi:hypothetical protein